MKGNQVNAEMDGVIVWKAYVEVDEDIKTTCVFAPTERAAREKLRRRNIEVIKLKQLDRLSISPEMITAVEKALASSSEVSEVMRKYVMTIFE